MTNREKIKEMSVEELASFLCNLMCADCCEDRCPAKAFCRTGHTGMGDWLKSEVETE